MVVNSSIRKCCCNPASCNYVCVVKICSAATGNEYQTTAGYITDNSISGCDCRVYVFGDNTSGSLTSFLSDLETTYGTSCIIFSQITLTFDMFGVGSADLGSGGDLPPCSQGSVGIGYQNPVYDNFSAFMITPSGFPTVTVPDGITVDIYSTSDLTSPIATPTETTVNGSSGTSGTGVVAYPFYASTSCCTCQNICSGSTAPASILITFLDNGGMADWAQPAIPEEGGTTIPAIPFDGYSFTRVQIPPYIGSTVNPQWFWEWYPGVTLDNADAGGNPNVQFWDTDFDQDAWPDWDPPAFNWNAFGIVVIESEETEVAYSMSGFGIVCCGDGTTAPSFAMASSAGGGEAFDFINGAVPAGSSFSTAQVVSGITNQIIVGNFMGGDVYGCGATTTKTFYPFGEGDTSYATVTYSYGDFSCSPLSLTVTYTAVFTGSKFGPMEGTFSYKVVITEA